MEARPLLARRAFAALDLGHPYRTPIGLQKTDGESLVNLEVTSYSAVSGEYFGHDFHVACQIQAVRIVFLNRFFAELGEYVLCALELRPAPLVPALVASGNLKH